MFKKQKFKRTNGDTLFITFWDEWVDAGRLLKHTQENVLKQQAFDKKKVTDKNAKSGRSAQTKPKSSADTKEDKEETKNNASKGKKREADSAIEDNVSTEKHVKIHPIYLEAATG